MFCSNCGNPLSDGALFCQHCGHAHQSPAKAKAATKFLTDLRSLKLKALFPFGAWIAEKPWNLGWVQALAFLAFFPLLIGLVYDSMQLTDLTQQLETAAWSLGAYFAVIWGVILYRTLKPGRLELQVIATTVLFTALIGITLAPAIKHLPVFAQFNVAKHSTDVGFQLIGYIFGVGLVEEAVKAIPLYFWFLIQKRPVTPREAAYAGILSGLAFGVAEAVDYSIQYANASYAGKLTPGQLLIAHFVRIVTLPLVHALWAGVVGYFIGLAALFPKKQAAIVAVGLLPMAVVHGAYDTFSDSWFALVLCVFSLLLFIMYMRSAEKVTAQLRSEMAAEAG